jgi:transposase
VTSTDYPGRVQMRRAYKFRGYPTRPQEGRAAALLADHCDQYNAALAERREAWRRSKVSVTYCSQSAQLRAIRAADPDGQGRHAFTAQQHGGVDADINAARNIVTRAGLGSGQAPAA